MYSGENRQASHSVPMFKNLQLGTYQGRTTDEPLDSLFNRVQTPEPPDGIYLAELTQRWEQYSTHEGYTRDNCLQIVSYFGIWKYWLIRFTYIILVYARDFVQHGQYTTGFSYQCIICLKDSPPWDILVVFLFPFIWDLSIIVITLSVSLCLGPQIFQIIQSILSAHF